MRLRGRAAAGAAVVAVAGAGLLGCTHADRAASVELSVFAGASLGDVMRAASPSYQSATPGVRLTIATDSSAALRTQIEHGAPADVFLSADEANARALFDVGLADGPALVFASNRLVIAVPAANPAAIDSPADLARPGLRVIAAGDRVPISLYAGQLIARLAALPGYPPDFASRYSENVVSREDNVSAIVAKIALAEGDAAIVYVTDARGAHGVSAMAVPDEASVVAVYAGVVLRRSQELDAARSFLSWLAAGDGQQILAQHGFGPPPDR